MVYNYTYKTLFKHSKISNIKAIIKMSRKISIPYKDIIPKYQTGYYSISQLAKEYNISKGGLSKYIKENNVRINERAQEATNALNKGFSTLEKIINERDLKINERPKETQNKGVIDTQNNDLTECKNINTLIVSEVIEIVKQKKAIMLCQRYFI
ncbi:hypothetical protein LS78_004105 [Helicobacter bilis]|nr:hypothetical protein LS78_004105 [Helicobacter bilis]